MRRLAGGAKPTSVDELRAGLSRIDAQLARAGGGRGAASVATLLLALTGALLSAIVLVVVLRVPPPPAVTAAPLDASVAPPTPSPAPAAATPDAGVTIAAPAPAPAPVAAPAAAPKPAPPPPPPCGALAVDGTATAPKLALACATELCGGATRAKLAGCKRDDGPGADLLAALRAADHERPLARLSCRPDGNAVTVRWLLGCVAPSAPPSRRGP
jgi:hypothetical protein